MAAFHVTVTKAFVQKKKTTKGKRCFTAQARHAPASGDEGDGRVGRDAGTPAALPRGARVWVWGAPAKAHAEPGKEAQLPVSHGSSVLSAL